VSGEVLYKTAGVNLIAKEPLNEESRECRNVDGPGHGAVRLGRGLSLIVRGFDNWVCLGE
jgi:hypothetical protein